MKLFTKRIVCSILGLLLVMTPLHAKQLAAETPPQTTTSRIFGTTLYDTALEISRIGWSAGSAPAVVLATGQNFPDALAGTVLASKVGGPLLLTPSNQLTPQVLDELVRLHTSKVYLLGGTVALNPAVETALTDKGYITQRLWGNDQYGTAAAIAEEVALKSAPGSITKAFLVTGTRFEDALSISAYAAAQGIPLLMSEQDKVPAETLKALNTLGIKSVTVIGGVNIIKPSVISQLAQLASPIQVDERLAGNDQYDTNLAILNRFKFDTSNLYVATGENFPDALAGATLAANHNQSILLVPRSTLSTAALSNLNYKRTSGTNFTILGGWNAVSYSIESMVRTGSSRPRISLQYVMGSSLSGQLNQLSALPNSPTDYADIISPIWYELKYLTEDKISSDGSVNGIWDSSEVNYSQYVSSVHARNLKILPLINSTWDSCQAIDSVLSSPTARANLVNQLVQRTLATGADGLVVDFEFMSNSSGPGLTAFMNELYAKLHPLNKLVVIAVMAKTGTEAWLGEFNYHDLAQAVDYMNIMTYDYSMSSPGPIAPLHWMNKVLQYARNQGVDMSKVLLGIPYYGRDWTLKPGTTSTYTQKALGLSTLPGPRLGALEIFSNYNATLQRDDSLIPYYHYKDADGNNHTVYYDDLTSWTAKLALLDQYSLAGIGAWSLYWVSPSTAAQLFPLLKQRLRNS